MQGFFIFRPKIGLTCPLAMLKVYPNNDLFDRHHLLALPAPFIYRHVRDAKLEPDRLFDPKLVEFEQAPGAVPLSRFRVWKQPCVHERFGSGIKKGRRCASPFQLRPDNFFSGPTDRFPL